MSMRNQLLGTLTMGMAVLASMSIPARSCNEVIVWSADLKGSAEKPAVETAATGKATIVFDFDHPKATMTIDNTGLQDVEKMRADAERMHAKATRAQEPAACQR